MIGEALKLIRDELEFYLQQSGDISAEVILENIAHWDGQNSGYVDNKITISLVNVEQESTLKNINHFRKNAIGGIDYEEPPIFINLYTLFCANYAGTGMNFYFKALKRLSNIIRFFQNKKSFSLANSPNASIADLIGGPNPLPPELESLRFTMELYTLTFEQINHLWGSLGGKQVPFVMYKCRLVQISEPVRQGASVIQEINNSVLTKP